MGLTTLHLVNNKIKDVAPLSGLTNLRGLMLGGNKIKDYSPLAALYPNLTDKDFEVQ
jgi:Leucine-rich repeat (LRR) protein